ncbi:MAG: hypothetical protein ACLFM4_07705 [Phormidium sp.]|nr:MAG: Protein of unknown function (DUF498/DUF598) [Phormidium sp. OSCR]
MESEISPTNAAAAQWRQQLDHFVRANSQELAALAWGLHLQDPDNDATLGIDIDPNPHFVTCPRAALVTLNEKVDNQLRVMMGVVENHNPKVEVLLLGIGQGQIQAIQYQPQPEPPQCFEEVGEDVETLLDRLEARMQGAISA